MGLTEAGAALGIHRVLNSQMAEGIRAITVRRGHDPRSFTLVALGGAGPLHAIALAEELGIRRILVPPHPGVLSAQGLLDATVEHEITTAFGHDLTALSPPDLAQAYRKIDTQARALIVREGIAPEACSVRHYADVCFVGQSHYLGVPVDLTRPDPITDIYQTFLETHDRINGHRFEAPAKIINLHTVHRAPAASGGSAKPRATATGEKIKKARRTVHLPGNDGAVEITVLDRATMPPGQTVIGPAIIEQADATTLLTGGWAALVSPSLTLILEQLSQTGTDEDDSH